MPYRATIFGLIGPREIVGLVKSSLSVYEGLPSKGSYTKGDRVYVGDLPFTPESGVCDLKITFRTIRQGIQYGVPLKSNSFPSIETLRERGIESGSSGLHEFIIKPTSDRVGDLRRWLSDRSDQAARNGVDDPWTLYARCAWHDNGFQRTVAIEGIVLAFLHKNTAVNAYMKFRGSDSIRA